MTDVSGYESFPTRIAVLCYLLSIIMYALGAYILAGFGWWMIALFLIYCLWVEYRVLKESCTKCYYYGKVCGLARGKICSMFFRQRVGEEFSSGEVTWTAMLPDALVTIIPVVGGIVLLIRNFNWPTLVAMIVLAVLFTGGNAIVRGSFACKYCRQRGLGCPAENSSKVRRGPDPKFLHRTRDSPSRRKHMPSDPIQWLTHCDEPWTRYRTLVDLLDRPDSDLQVHAAHGEMLAHPRVHALIAETGTWPGYALKRHNDANHPIYKLSALADFGVRADDEGMAGIVQAVVSHQSPEGAFQTLANVSPTYGGTGEDIWAWMLCDAPTLLYCLLAMGLSDDPRVGRAVGHLVGLVDEVGWKCVVSPEFGGKFRGPGRKSDPCPIANVYALKALSLAPEQLDSLPTRAGVDMILSHWERQRERKIYMFGIGTDFRKLKYPFVWYDILHVMDVLSRFPFAHTDSRFREMVETITDQADENGRYTAGSMYRAWKGWSFADKKNPSPWLTFLVLRIMKRTGEGAAAVCSQRQPRTDI